MKRLLCVAYTVRCAQLAFTESVRENIHEQTVSGVIHRRMHAGSVQYAHTGPSHVVWHFFDYVAL